jgi:hypothetical protein
LLKRNHSVASRQRRTAARHGTLELMFRVDSTFPCFCPSCKKQKHRFVFLREHGGALCWDCFHSFVVRKPDGSLLLTDSHMRAEVRTFPTRAAAQEWCNTNGVGAVVGYDEALSGD